MRSSLFRLHRENGMAIVPTRHGGWELADNALAAMGLLIEFSV